MTRRPAERSPAWWQGAGAAMLSALLVAALIAASFTSALRALRSNDTSWTGHAYGVLTEQLALVLIDPQEASRGRLAILRASFENPGEYKELAAVEALGDARLARVRALFERGERTQDSKLLRAALREADALSAQARQLLQDRRVSAYRHTRRLQALLTLAGALSVIAFAGLLARALSLWRAERERRAQEARLSRELSLMASHELRRPLQQLALAADLLQHGHLGESERARVFGRLQDSAAQLAVLSDLSRLEAVYLEPRLDLAARDLALVLAPLARPGVMLALESGVIWPVDELRLRQSVENLLDNALKYSAVDGAPGEVRLELWRAPFGPEIHVVDRGPGIPEADRERVFEPFYRSPNSPAHGHGLGLAIARRLVRAHGGDIELLAEGGGTRAVVRLRVPGRERAATGSGPRRAREKQQSGAGS